MDRNLDGCYFRVQRNGEWQNICFSDLKTPEREEVLRGRSIEWLKSLCNILADRLISLGDQFDIICE